MFNGRNDLSKIEKQLEKTQTALRKENDCLEALQNRIKEIKQGDILTLESKNALSKARQEADLQAEYCHDLRSQIQVLKDLLNNTEKAIRKEGLSTVVEQVDKLCQTVADRIAKEYEPAAKALGELAAAERHALRCIEAVQRLVEGSSVPCNIAQPMRRLDVSGKGHTNLSALIGFPLQLPIGPGQNGITSFSNQSGEPRKNFDNLCIEAAQKLVKKPVQLSGVYDEEIPEVLTYVICGQKDEDAE